MVILAEILISFFSCGFIFLDCGRHFRKCKCVFHCFFLNLFYWFCFFSVYFGFFIFSYINIFDLKRLLSFSSGIKNMLSSCFFAAFLRFSSMNFINFRSSRKPIQIRWIFCDLQNIVDFLVRYFKMILFMHFRANNIRVIFCLDDKKQLWSWSWSIL